MVHPHPHVPHWTRTPHVHVFGTSIESLQPPPNLLRFRRTHRNCLTRTRTLRRMKRVGCLCVPSRHRTRGCRLEPRNDSFRFVPFSLTLRGGRCSCCVLDSHTIIMNYGTIMRGKWFAAQQKTRPYSPPSPNSLPFATSRSTWSGAMNLRPVRSVPYRSRQPLHSHSCPGGQGSRPRRAYLA